MFRNYKYTLVPITIKQEIISWDLTINLSDTYRTHTQLADTYKHMNFTTSFIEIEPVI